MIPKKDMLNCQIFVITTTK